MYLLSPYHHSYNSKVLLYLSRQSTFLQILKPCSTFDISYPTWHWVTLLYCTNVFNCAYFYTSWYKMFCTGIFLWNDSYFYISDTGPNLNLSGKYISLWIRNTQIWYWSKYCWYLSYYYFNLDFHENKTYWIYYHINHRVSNTCTTSDYLLYMP